MKDCTALGTYVGDGDRLVIVTTEILKQVLDEDGTLRNLAVDGDLGVVRGLQVDLLLGLLLGGHCECGWLILVVVKALSGVGVLERRASALQVAMWLRLGRVRVG